MALASGWVLVSSAAMASDITRFSSMSSASLIIETTFGRPSVMVPVLSSSTVLAALICSMYAPPLMSTPRLTAVLMAAEKAVAVDSLMPQE